MLSEAERRVYLNLSLAQLRSEGAHFTPAYLADCERVIRGELSEGELRERHIARVLAALSSAEVSARSQSDGERWGPALRDGIVASRLRELMEARANAAESPTVASE